MKTVGNRMTSPVLSIEQGESINSAARKIYDNTIGSLLVTHDEKFTGILPTKDLQ